MFQLSIFIDHYKPSLIDFSHLITLRIYVTSLLCDLSFLWSRDVTTRRRVFSFIKSLFFITWRHVVPVAMCFCLFRHAFFVITWRRSFCEATCICNVAYFLCCRDFCDVATICQVSLCDVRSFCWHLYNVSCRAYNWLTDHTHGQFSADEEKRMREISNSNTRLNKLRERLQT